MRNQKGFTLIELIIVIVVLGILAVTAAPQFINLAGDARAGTLEGVRASMQSASTLINAKSKVQGIDETRATGETVSNNSSSVAVAYGYPDAFEIYGLLDVDSEDFNVVYESGSGAPSSVDAAGVDAAIVYAVSQGEPSAGATEGCFVRYKEPTAVDGKPDYELETEGC